MNRFFGTSTKKETPSLNSAIESSTVQQAIIEERIKKLDSDLNKIKHQLKTTKANSAKTSLKARAMRIINQKRTFETQLDNISQQTFNMEQANFMTTNLKNTVETMQAMKSSNKELKKNFKSINIDKLEELQEEMHEMMQDAEEVQEVLGRSFNVPDDIDEAELDAELEALEEEELFETVEETGTQIPSYLAGKTKETPDVFVDKLNERAETLQLDEYGLPKEPVGNL